MLQPLGYRLLLEPDNLEETTAGGIVIPDTVLDKERLATQIGKVLAIGEYAWHDFEKPWVKVGDRVMFAKYSQKRIKDPISGKDYLVCNDEDIIAILREENENG